MKRVSRWVGIVPTVHLSLPETLYNDLREVAAELGIQITDLIKIMIREGIEARRAVIQERRRKQEEATEALIQILEKIEKLQQQLEEYQAYVEGELYRMSQKVGSLSKRLTKLEDIVEERIIPVETPELIQP